MRKILTLICLACMFLTNASAQQTIKVQGHPRKVPANVVKKVMRVATTTQTFDPSKVKYIVGEGANTSYLIIDWCDGKSAQKLVWGYKYNDEDNATGEMMLKAVAKTDPRFYMLAFGGTQYGSTIGGMGFDLNNNGVLGLKKADGTTYSVDADGLVSTTSYDFDDYSPQDETDHWCSGWYNGYFSYWVAATTGDDLGYSGVGATGRKLSDGCVDQWVYSSFSGETFSEADYYMYLNSEKGLTLPAEITLKLSDNSGVVPVVLNLKGETLNYAVSWTIQNEDGKTDRSIISRVTSTKENPEGVVTFTGKTGVAYLTATAYIGGKRYTSEKCKVTVAAPEKPVTALAYANETMTAEINGTCENALTITPADATFKGLTYTSSNTGVATVGSDGKVKVGTKPGTTTITAQSAYNPEVSASYELVIVNSKPVTEIQVKGGDVIEMEERDILPKPEVTVLPEDANYKEVTYTIENTEVASFYQNNIVAHKKGETKIIIEAADGSGVTATVKLIVKEQDRTPYDGYQDGTFILNEAWFGHENGDMNFITSDGNMMYRVYERENAGQAFGATSCSATIYGGKMYVMSKQDKDGGDLTTTGGGRLVVMDAKTLKKIAGFNTLPGGDGRSAVGVNPGKVYLGTAGGVVTFDVDNMEVGDVIPGTNGGSSYSGQIGDMLKAGKYVFALQQKTGVHVINTETDLVESTISDSDVQGIAQTPDGNVWIASTNTLTCVNPETLETVETVTLPEGNTIGCSWGSWRPTPFCASRTKNVLYWNVAGGWSNGPEYYRYEVGTDITGLKPLFSISGMKGEDETKSQTPYGTVRYDDRKDELIVMTTQSGYGANYEHNWIHFVDGTTGELKRTITLKPYYWFQALPVFPDKYAPEFTEVESEVNMQTSDEAVTIDLTGKVTDKDNLVCNIVTALADAGDNNVATAELDGKSLKITPVSEGKSTIKLTAESNGVVTEHLLTVTVSTSSGIAGVNDGSSISVEDGRIVINGYDGWVFYLYNAAGQTVRTFTAKTCDQVSVANGVYILKGCKGANVVSKKISL